MAFGDFPAWEQESAFSSTVQGYFCSSVEMQILKKKKKKKETTHYNITAKTRQDISTSFLAESPRLKCVLRTRKDGWGG